MITHGVSLLDLLPIMARPEQRWRGPVELVGLFELWRCR